MNHLIKNHKNAIVYHDRCVDGTCSLCILHKYLDENGSSDTVLIPGNYDNLDNIFNHELADRDVFFVDFSLKPQEMELLSKRVKQIKVIDHHDSTVSNYQNFLSSASAKDGFQRGLFKPNVELVLDKERSGALMTWDYFYKTPAPKAVQYVSDGDLFDFHLPETRSFYSRVAMNQLTEQSMADLIWASPQKLQQFVDEGNLLQKQYLEMCRKDASTASDLTIRVDNQEWRGDFVVSSREMRNDVAHILYMKNHQFVAVLTGFDGDNYSISFRSKNHRLHKDTVDVEQLAKKFGGGGHASSSGISITKEQFNKCFHVSPKMKNTVKPRF